MPARSKRTKARVAAILDAIRLGQPYMRAARAGGIDYSSFQNWMRNDASFSQAVEAATADGERYVLGCLREAASEGSVTAMLGWLERRFPDDWSRGERLKQEHSGSVDVRVAIQRWQAALDEVLPDDAEVKRKFAEKVIEQAGGNEVME